MNLRDFIRDEEIIDIAKALISIESHEKEGKAAVWVKDYLEREGIEVSLDKLEEERFNVYGEIKGVSDKCGLMFNGHLDTVPGTNMDFDACSPFVMDGRLYGRGACDMKGAIAAMLGAITAVKRANIKLNNGVMFAGVIDEENRSSGTERIVKQNMKADAVVIGEPTELQVAIMHKGLENIEVVFNGKAAHASKGKEGISAVRAASEFIRLIYEELEPRIEANEMDMIGCGSICPSVINGGKTINIVPEKCSVIIDRRWLPNETVKSVFDEIEEMAKKAVEKMGGHYKIINKNDGLSTMGNVSFMIDKDSVLVQEALKTVENELGTPQTPVAFPAWTDAALLSNFGGLDCIILGPGSIEQAHTSNEFCDIDQIIKATHIYMDLIEKMCIRG